jgi:hypothetical protein
MRRIGDQPVIETINVEVRGLQNRLADQNFIAEDERLLGGATAKDFNVHRFGDVYFIATAIGIFGHLLTDARQAELFSHERGQDEAHCAGIN